MGCCFHGRNRIAARDQRRCGCRQRKPAEQGQQGDTEGRQAGIGRDIALALAKMAAAMFQARIVAHRLAARQVDGFLGVEAGGEGFGIGLLVAQA